MSENHLFNLQLAMLGETRRKHETEASMNLEMLKRVSRQAYDSGMSYERIARQVGVAKRTVWLWLNEQG